MKAFLKWFNSDVAIDPVLKAAIAHLWFVTVHPFDDGNGRIARAIADMGLARSEQSPQRFYSMSAQIRLERKAYYDVLENTQQGDLDVTVWLSWFLSCLDRAFGRANDVLANVVAKSRFWQAHGNAAFNDRQRDMINRLLEGFEGKLTSSKWAKIEKCSQDTASRDIDDLVGRGVLARDAGGGRSTNYLLVKPGDKVEPGCSIPPCRSLLGCRRRLLERCREFCRRHPRGNRRATAASRGCPLRRSRSTL